MIDPTILVTANGYYGNSSPDILFTVIPTDNFDGLDWTRASTKTRVNQNGVIETMTNNIPTLDYTNGVCPVIGIEPQRTNAFQRSEEITNAYWTKTGATASGNTQTAPDNTLTADSLIATNTTGRHEVSRAVATPTSPGGKYVASFYVKKGNVNYAYIEGTAAVWLGSCIVDLNNGNVVSQTGTNTINVTVTLINGYYRISLCILIVGSGSATVRFGMTSSASSTSSTLTTSNFTYMWGFQWEYSDNLQYVTPTSYIPTTTASVTRIADVVTTNEANMLQYTNRNEGVVFIKVNFKANIGVKNYFTFSRTLDFQNFLLVSATEANKINVAYGVISSIQANITSANAYSNGILKIAFGYKANNFVLYINGVLVGTDTLGITGFTINNLNLTPFSDTRFNSGNELIYAAVYNERLSNSDLAELTTL